MNITAADQWTTTILKQDGDGWSVSISGTFVATVVVQRAKKENGPWFDIYSTTTSAELDGDFTTAFYLRAGVKPGAFTSGTAVVDVY